MTAQDIFNMAVERSNLNDASLVGEAQWIAALSAYQQRVYLAAARENPDFFGVEGTTATRGSSTATWSTTAAPGQVGAISKVLVDGITGTVPGLSVGSQVNLISIRHPEHGLSPRAYIRNKVIYEYNSELQADASNFVTRLKLYYSLLPATLTTTSDTISLPDEHVHLLVLPLARYLAIRDQRPEEAAVLDEEFALEWQNFIQHISVFDEATVREIGQIPSASRRLTGAQ